MPYIAKSKTTVPASNAKNRVLQESLMISGIVYDQRESLKPGGIDEEEDSQTNPCTRSNLSDCGEGRSVEVTERCASQEE
jgi:hypothetical protein